MVHVSESPLGVLAATDFVSVEVFTFKGLIMHYLLFFIDIASRSVHVAGVTPSFRTIRGRYFSIVAFPSDFRRIKTVHEDQSTSNRAAAPMPPPMHIVTTTRFAPRLFPAINA